MTKNIEFGYVQRSALCLAMRLKDEMNQCLMAYDMGKPSPTINFEAAMMPLSIISSNRRDDEREGHAWAWVTMTVRFEGGAAVRLHYSGWEDPCHGFQWRAKHAELRLRHRNQNVWMELEDDPECRSGDDAVWRMVEATCAKLEAFYTAVEEAHVACDGPEATRIATSIGLRFK